MPTGRTANAQKRFFGRDQPPPPSKWDLTGQSLDPELRQRFSDPTWHRTAQGGSLLPKETKVSKKEKKKRRSAAGEGTSSRQEGGEGGELADEGSSGEGSDRLKRQRTGLYTERFPLSVSPVPSSSSPSSASTPSSSSTTSAARRNRCQPLPVQRAVAPKVPNRRDHFRPKKVVIVTDQDHDP